MDILKIFKSDKDGARKSHLKNLICVAMADGKIDEQEWELLSVIARALGITEDEIEKIAHSPENVQFQAPATYGEKVEQIQDLVAVMTVDGAISPKELSLCKKISLKLDILPQMVDDIIEDYYIASRSADLN